jgi:hypothetical protein
MSCGNERLKSTVRFGSWALSFTSLTEKNLLVTPAVKVSTPDVGL